VAAIRWNVQHIAKERGIESVSQLAEALKVAPGTATDLWHGRVTRIDLGTMLKVCIALKCTPGDVLLLEGDTSEGNKKARLVA
jgi:DNA-binding Xre family transcriptional regulator